MYDALKGRSRCLTKDIPTAVGSELGLSTLVSTEFIRRADIVSAEHLQNFNLEESLARVKLTRKAAAKSVGTGQRANIKSAQKRLSNE